MKSFFELLRVKRLRLKGQKLLTRGKIEKAFPVFQKAAMLIDSMENIYNLALSLSALGRYEEAEEYLEKINSKIPGNEMVLLTLGECKLMQKKWSAAGFLYQELIKLNPRSESYEKYFRLANDPIEREKYVNSKILLSQATRALQSKKDKEALNFLMEANETYPNNPNILNNIGSIYMLLKDYKKAYKYFSEALNFDRDNVKIKKNVLAARKKL